MNENHIKTLRIENFKSIKEMDLECSRINVFVGKPNVGKSNISTNSQRPFSEFVRYNRLSNFFYDNDIEKNILIDAKCYGVDYAKGVLALKAEDHIFFIFGESAVKIQAKLANNPDLDIVGSSLDDLLADMVFVMENENTTDRMLKNNVTRYDNDLPSKPSIKKYNFKKGINTVNGHDESFSSYLLPPFGQNLVRIMEVNKKFRDKVAGFFKEYGHGILIDNTSKTFEIQKIVDNISYKTDYNLIADTLQRMIFHHAAILSNKNSVILFEEPESHAYPPYIGDLAYEIIDSESNQFFIATHSPYLLNTLMENTPREDLSIFVKPTFRS